MSGPAVELVGVSLRRAGQTALEDLTLSVQEGAVTGLVGPNGAGKTSVIEAVCGLLRPQRGEVRVFGRDIRREGRAIRRQVGLVPQETALYDEVSAWRNLRFAADLYDLRGPDGRIAELLELAGLTERAHDPVHTYSTGMRRRLAVVRALLHEPPLLILDEPTLGVDVEARHQIWTHLRGIRAQRRTVLLTTNYMDEAEALCDRVVVLNRGRVVADDAPENLLSRAGRCIELECSPESAITLQEMFGEDPEVLRSELTESGLRLFVRRASLPESLVRRAMERTPVSGFRVRSPDLAEVFRVLPAGPA